MPIYILCGVVYITILLTCIATGNRSESTPPTGASEQESRHLLELLLNVSYGQQLKAQQNTAYGCTEQQLEAQQNTAYGCTEQQLKAQQSTAYAGQSEEQSEIQQNTAYGQKLKTWQNTVQLETQKNTAYEQTNPQLQTLQNTGYGQQLQIQENLVYEEVDGPSAEYEQIESKEDSPQQTECNEYESICYTLYES